MIRICRTGGQCATCAAYGLILRISVASSSGGGGTRDLCEYHARALVHGVADVADSNCSSCGHRGSVVQVGGDHFGKYKRDFAVCTKRCAPQLMARIGEAMTLKDGDSTEWDDSWEPPSWWSSHALANQKAGRR